MEKSIESVNNLLIAAGDAILKVYDSNDFNTSVKADNSPVTRADKTSSAIINSGLNEIFADIPVIDEETSTPDFEVRKYWNHFFLVDPLDGTREFIKRNGEFCINLALIQKNYPVKGWIYQPLTGKGWFAEKGKGIIEFDRAGNYAEIDFKVVESEKFRIVTSRSYFKPLEEELINKIMKHFQVEIIQMGSSLKQIALILGKADMYLKAGPCSEWDTAPGHLMVEESGGAVLCHNNFVPMVYNKPVLSNPHFVMLNSKFNTLEFRKFLRSQFNN